MVWCGCGVVWCGCDMVWCGCGVVWCGCGVVCCSCGVVWCSCGVMWCGYDVMWCGCGMVWCGCGVVWCGCGVVWCGCGVVWCGIWGRLGWVSVAWYGVELCRIYCVWVDRGGLGGGCCCDRMRLGCGVGSLWVGWVDLGVGGYSPPCSLSFFCP
jgi:hypothetical protein